MTQAAKAQEPSMEEILASIRRIIADDDKPAVAEAPPAKPAAPSKPAPAAAKAPPKPVVEAKPAAEPVSNSQDDIDAMLADLDASADDEPVAPAPDVLELTEDMAVAAPESFNKIHGHDDIEFSEQPAPTPMPAVEPLMQQVEAAVVQQMPLVSTQTVSAVNTAFNALANTVLSQNARTLEDLVREMLRPMLKSWLDDNLPGMVERLVKAEIERVSRGR